MKTTPTFAGAGTPPTTADEPPADDTAPATTADGTGASSSAGGSPARKRKTARKRPAARRDSSPRPPGRPTVKASMAEQLDETFVGLGAIVAAFNEYDGLTIMAGSPRLSDSLASLAAKDPRVRKALERFLATSGWGGVIAAAVVIAVPILANHGIMPESLKAIGPAGERVTGDGSGLDLADAQRLLDMAGGLMAQANGAGVG